MLASVPTQIGSRSCSVISAWRTMCGVRVRMRSVRLWSLALLLNRWPSTGISDKPGSPCSLLESSVRIRPAIRLVSPSRRRIVDSMVRVPMRGCCCPPEPWMKPLMLDTSTRILSVISWLWCTRGSISMVMPTSWYWNEVTGMMFDPTVLAVLKLVTGIGTRSPITARAFSPSLERSCGWARSWASVDVFMKL